jgi:Ca2+-binding EF-hand superfamily protein
MPRLLAPLVAAIVTTIALALPAAAQTDAEPPRKGIGNLLGKAADRLKEEAMKRFDKNGDGRLDDEERAEALREMKKKGGEIQGQLRQFMLRRYDADGNGALDPAERKTAFDETMKQLEENGPLVKNTVLGFVHKRFDANGDGTLDKDELGVARDELTKRIIEGIPMGDVPTKPIDPVARRKQAEEKRKAEMLDRFDADGNGTLDEQEREAAKSELKKRYEELDAAAAADAPAKPAADPAPR